jgi:hypothetical protein
MAFDAALGKARDSVEEAVKASEEALKANDPRAFEDAERRKTAAAKQSANLIKSAYRELGVRSQEDLENLKKQAVSAFEAMKASGVASARDIAEAQKNLERRLEDLDRQLGKTENSIELLRRRTGDLNLAWSSFVGNLGANFVSGIFDRLTGAVTGFFGGLSANIQRAGIQTENLKAQLKTIEGSVRGAEEAYKQIADFARTTPYELDQVTAAYVALANRGMKPTEEQLQAIGDMAASQQKPLQQYVEAILDAMTGENERLKEFGIKASKSGDQVSFTFRGITKTVEATDTAILNTLLSFSKMDGVIGGMNERAKTTEGQLSNLTDALNAVYVKLFDAIKPAQDALIRSATAIISPLAEQEDLYGAIGDRARELSGYLEKNPEIVEEIRKQLREGILLTFNSISAAAKQVLEYLKENPKAIEEAIKNLGTLLGLMKSFVELIGTALEGWRKIGDTLKEIKGLMSGGGSEIDGIRRSVSNYGPEAAAEFDRRFADAKKPRPGGNFDMLIPGRMEEIAYRIAQDVIFMYAGRSSNAGDYPGPPIPSGGAAPLPVPKPSRTRGGNLPPPPSSSGSSGKRPEYAKGFERLSDLESLLKTNPLFANNPTALAAALAIAAGESGSPWLRAGSNVNLIQARGGTGNAMQGFAQFNTNYFKNLNSPSAYINFLAEILTGKRNLPTGRGRFNVGELERLISSGAINTPKEFLSYLQRALPIANWEGLFGKGADRVLQSGVLDVQLGRLASDIPRSEIAATDRATRERERQAEERQREAERKAKEAEREAERARQEIERSRRRFQDSVTPPGVYPEIGTFGIYQDALLKMLADRDYRLSPLPDFGGITPPGEFGGLTYGEGTFGQGIAPVSYPDRLIETATAAREATEQLNEAFKKFTNEATVGVDNVSSSFEGLGEKITGMAEDAFGQFFDDILSGSRSIGDALLELVGNFARSLASMFAQMATSSLFNWIRGIFGGGVSFGSGGFSGGGFGDLFSGASFSTIPNTLGFARGGPVRGGGNATSDSIAAWLSNGEFVINAAAVDYWGENFLDDINAKRPPRLNLDLGETTGSNHKAVNQSITVNVTSPDAAGFGRTERQIGRMLSEYAGRS